MTWRDNLWNAFLLAHEFGHTDHQLLTGQSQIGGSTQTPTFLDIVDGAHLFFGEAPTPINEVRLGQHLLATTEDLDRRLFIIEQFPSTFTHNMVTHMLEAHFEPRLYGLADACRAITTKAVLDAQGEVFERFYGDEVVVDDRARLYWMEQPHFYLNGGLYPHTYAAGLACAVAVAERIRSEGQPAVDRWLETLRLGTRLPPLELAAHAGVDMSRPEPVRQAAALFGELVTELERSYA